ncbi:DIS3-like exonuclease 2 [Phlebotomus argentipes]|uniref:DIS3-like exonuclease 2 n=1 Tax=Phlebotomus argentipes TaxID=94469 RepID=UPI0028929B03|nr:DIS3-like exonuclease 2 [Phlebotomus argentipes]
MDSAESRPSRGNPAVECQNAHQEGNIANVLATLESLQRDFERHAISDQTSGGAQIDGEAAGKAPKEKKKRNRVKPKAKPKRYADISEISLPDNVAPLESNSRNVRNHGSHAQTPLKEENITILQLLSMDPDEREKYLMRLALERNLLSMTGEGSNMTLRINPLIYRFLNNFQLLDVGVNLHKIRENFSRRVNKSVQQQPDMSPQQSSQQSEKKEKKARKPAIELSEIEEAYVKLLERKPEGSEDEVSGVLKAFAEKLVAEKRAVMADGEIRVSAVNYHNAYMANPSGGRDIIFRQYALRRHAFPGDQVLALVFKMKVEKQDSKADATLGDNDLDEATDDDDEDKKSTDSAARAEEAPIIEEREVGVVIEILEKRHNRLIVGTFDRPSLVTKLLTPRDNRLPRVKITNDGVIRGLAANGKMMKKLIFLARITHSRSSEVCGQLLKVVGQIGELESENRAILLANDLNPEPYPEAILAELPRFDVQPSDFQGREDLRSSTCIFTIDPPTARDLDDAMSCVRIDDNTFEVGVHIADVAHYIPENSPLDMILRKKTTSIYLVNTVYHMLPLPMCLNCSLLPGKDRLAFSVFWRMDSSGKILDERITKSIINSCTQLAYDHAQLVIDGPREKLAPDMFPAVENEHFKLEDVLESVQNLYQLSRRLREKRFADGAVKMDQPKIGFTLDAKTGDPVKYHREVIRESNQLIEEFMLLANMTVARWIHEKFPLTAVLRCHNEPDKHQFEKLTNELRNAGVAFDLSSTTGISASLEKAIAERKDKEAAKVVLTCMLTKPMMRARYFCSGMTESEDEFRHYFLSIPIYTHFTSPIRRYPDVLVHRLLAATVAGAATPQLSCEELHGITNTCNAQKYSAKLASTDSTNLYFFKYLESLNRVIDMRAAVYKLGLSFVEVILIDTNHHVKVTFGGGKASFVGDSKQTIEIVKKGKHDITSKLTLSVFSECKIAVTARKGKLNGKLIWL